MHGDERRVFELGPRGVEGLQLVRLAIVEEGARRRRERVVANDPQLVVVGARLHREFALEVGLQELQRAADVGIERGPLVAQVIGRIGLDLAGDGIGQYAADVRLVVFGHDALLAGPGILRDDGGGVAAAAVDPVHGPAVAGVTRRAGGERVVERGALGGCRGHLAVAYLEHVRAAGRVLAQRPAQLELIVRHEADVAVVLHDELGRAGAEVEQVDVVKARIAVVDADQHLVLDRVGRPYHLHQGVFKRGELALLARFDVHLVEQEVFIARLVLHVEDAVRGGRPEVLADRAVG